MYNYFVRVDYHEGYEGRIRSVMHQTDSMLGVFHTGKHGDNPHWHFAISIGDVRTKEALRARLRKEWTVPKSISIREWDGEKKCLSYMFHEKDRESFKVVADKGYSEEDIAMYKEESYTKGPRNEEGVAKKKKEKTFSEKMVEDALEHFKPGGMLVMVTDSKGHVRVVGRDEVIRWVIRRFSKNMKVFDKFIVNRAYHLVAHHLFGEEIEDELIFSIIELNNK